MKNYANRIEGIIMEMDSEQIFKASELYSDCFFDIPESAFYKCIERLTKKEVLMQLARGLYYRPRGSRFGVVPLSEDKIIASYTGCNAGVATGYRLYNQKGLSTQIPKKSEFLSNKIDGNIKTIGNIKLKKINMELDDDSIEVLEIMEILRCYNMVEDINYRAFVELVADYSKRYNENVAIRVIENMNYKKATIAFLVEILAYFNVENNLKRFLSHMSVYKVPKMEELYELA